MPCICIVLLVDLCFDFLHICHNVLSVHWIAKWCCVSENFGITVRDFVFSQHKKQSIQVTFLHFLDIFSLFCQLSFSSYILISLLANTHPSRLDFQTVDVNFG